MPYTEQDVRQQADARIASAGLTDQERYALYAYFRGGQQQGQDVGNYDSNLKAAITKLGFTNTTDWLKWAQGYGALWGNGESWDSAAQYMGLQPPGAGPNPEDAKNKQSADDLAAALDAFAKHMMDPLDMSDPTVQRIMQNATAQVGKGVYGAGAGGGMADAAMAAGVTGAGAQLYQQRAALGASVMGGRLQDQRQLNAYRDQANRMALDDKYQNQLSAWESQRGTGQMFGGLVGAGLGALPGIFTLNPALAVTGASAGYSLGAGVGASAYGGPPAKPVYNSPYYGGGMSSSGRMGY